jgi:hypothetical protein
MENKYYTPEISDLRIGYECEANVKLYGSVQDDWKPIILKGVGQEIVYYHSLGVYRTPFLTKEQIEKEGWDYKGKTMDIWFEKEGSFEMNSWTAYKAKLQYGLQDKRLRIFVVDIDKTEYDCFRGFCKSINEFRTITKWLGI